MFSSLRVRLLLASAIMTATCLPAFAASIEQVIPADSPCLSLAQAWHADSGTIESSAYTVQAVRGGNGIEFITVKPVTGLSELPSVPDDTEHFVKAMTRGWLGAVKFYSGGKKPAEADVQVQVFVEVPLAGKLICAKVFAEDEYNPVLVPQKSMAGLLN